MSYWLMKSEPDEASIDHALALKEKGIPWTGVRNYQARNFMRDQMRIGDGVLFYHSSCEQPGIAGIAEVASDSYPDPTQFDPQSDYFDPKSPLENPRWILRDVAFRQKFQRVIALSELREVPGLEGMEVNRKGQRLSVMPVTEAEWNIVLSLPNL